MKPLAAILCALLFAWTSAGAAGCPAAYPADFPCLPGGSEFEMKELLAILPTTSKGIALQYPGPPKERYEQLVAAATAQGWTIESREEASEMDGQRYRARFQKAERVTSISVFGSPKAALVLVISK